MDDESGESVLINQRNWRRVGAIAIGAASMFAVYAVFGGVLRDSVIHTVRIFGGEVPDTAVAARPVWVCALYWGVFAGSILTALWMAALDVRFIRLRYAVERQRLVRESLEIAAASKKESGSAETETE